MNKYHCQCRPGFIGELCETNVNECASSPCMNGGVCTELVNSFKCACPSGWTGQRCEMDVRSCDSDPCLNNAKCIDLLGDFFCACPSGTDGKRYALFPLPSWMLSLIKSWRIYLELKFWKSWIWKKMLKSLHSLKYSQNRDWHSLFCFRKAAKLPRIVAWATRAWTRVHVGTSARDLTAHVAPITSASVANMNSMLAPPVSVKMEPHASTTDRVTNVCARPAMLDATARMILLSACRVLVRCRRLVLIWSTTSTAAARSI